MKLGDLGERRILREVIGKYSQSSGNDCESMDVDTGTVVFTTDPVPPPAAGVIGGDPDPYWAGWLLVTINASDVAASGADPLAFLVAAEFPASQSVVGFERFLAGVKDACDVEGFPYSGGNLRESKMFAATGIAAGWLPRSSQLGRKGGTPGDLIVSVGRGGLFWRDALLVRSGHEVDKDVSPLFRPRSQGHAMRALRRAGLVRASMDTSDGLVPTLEELARLNGATAVLQASQLDVPDAGLIVPEVINDPRKLWLGWGDWTVVALMATADLDQATQLAAAEGTPIVPIGYLEAGPPSLVIESAAGRRPAGRLESERFAKDSWFEAGIDGYIKLLKEFDLG